MSTTDYALHRTRKLFLRQTGGPYMSEMEGLEHILRQGLSVDEAGMPTGLHLDVR